MSEQIEKRIAALSPADRAEVLRRLRARERGSGAKGSPGSNENPIVLETTSPREPDALKASYERFYDTVTAQLDASIFGPFSFFLNYGYVSDGSAEHAAMAVPQHFVNRNSVKLVLETVGDCPIDGRRLLDVGCGRGGTLYTLKTFFKPRSLTGLDLSSAAIEFDRKAHGDAITSFHAGDAEHLPFADSTFDVVTNIESSHSYPNVHRFYDEVHRVLVPGGHFVYTDALAVQQIASALAYLAHVGFEVERNTDITRNVLLSCEQVSTTRVQAFDSRNDRDLMSNFLATPGSQVFEEMRSGRWQYRIYKLRKRS